ncbi:EXO5 [Candida pseudojiufengensis]|uniref:EXO5 n=1 Tax=Candida pseudojiufengensis TaxID=497109 RepID=UPI0022257F3B|nr:EXO5 [Candida pseudojiufengensis]KAI5963620.1 EXO5 [Candida pseudojiufengensis]
MRYNLPRNLRFQRLYSTQLNKPVLTTTSIIKESLVESTPINASPKKRKKRLNKNLKDLYSNWNLNQDQDLPITSPIPVSPYEYYITNNSNESIIKFPRLSVTKLLINNWCQLREYYQIYSGSKKLKGNNIKQGQNYHSKLEEITHDSVDFENELKFINLNIENLKLECNDNEFKELEKLSEFNQNDELVNDWSNQIISRLFNLIVNSESREVLVHGFINLDQGKLITNDSDLPGATLISGVIDLLKFRNPKTPKDLKFFVDIQNLIEFEFGKIDDKLPIIDLSIFIKEVKEILNEYNNQKLSLNIVDIKSRTWNQLPNYDSVLKGAKLQTYYYKNMFENLASDPFFTYNSLIKNAEIRGCNIDEPINQILVLKLLKQYSYIFYEDFLKLSNGEPIGFEPFDNHTNETSYNFGVLFQDLESFSLNNPNTTSFMKELENSSDFNYQKLITPLLKNWKTPPTLRYFASRSSQFYTLFQNFINSDSTYVEYHNSKTELNFKTIKYKYNEILFNNQLVEASKFWNGTTTKPEAVDDLNKCKYCDFASKCIIGKNEIKSS